MKRIITGLCIGVVLIVAFLLRSVSLYIFDVTMGVLSVFASMEIAKLLNKQKKHNIIFANVVFPAILYFWLLIGVAMEYSLTTMLIGGICILVGSSIITFVVLLMCKIYTRAMMNVSGYEGSRISFCFEATLDTAFGFIVPSFLLLLSILFNHITAFGAELSNVALFNSYDLGMIVLLAWFGTSIMSDICAFYVGSLIRGKKLCEKISPNKTISGSIGGLLGSILFVVLAYILMCTDYTLANILTSIGINYFVVIIFGLVASIFTQIGDLFVSLLKRKANVKDINNLLPGHGGIMDRCDGLCLNALWVLIFFIIVL